MAMGQLMMVVADGSIHLYIFSLFLRVWVCMGVVVHGCGCACVHVLVYCVILCCVCVCCVCTNASEAGASWGPGRKVPCMLCSTTDSSVLCSTTDVHACVLFSTTDSSVSCSTTGRKEQL